MNRSIGILGGMGPLATVDFITKIIKQTPANRDQDHIPLLVQSVPQIPDRTAHLMEKKASPLSALSRGLKTLVDAKVGCIAIPCNTAHYWYDDLAKVSNVPILHIAQACAEQLSQQQITSVGLLATDGTLKAGFYPKELATFGIDVTLPKTALQQRVMQGIYQVKSGLVEEGGYLLEQCMGEMLQQGVERVILGCTEIPFALEHINSPSFHFGVDATKALALSCVQWHMYQCQRAA